MTVFRIVLTILATHVMLIGSAAHAEEKAALVFGGSGRLGSEIVKQLMAVDMAVTVFVRPTSDRSRLEGLDVSYIIGDILDEDDVAASLDEREYAVVINAISARSGETVPYEQGQRHINSWAKQTGVDHVIFLSSVGAGENASVVPESMQKFQEPFRDQLVEKGVAEVELQDSGLTYTIIRTGAVLPEGAAPTGQGKLVEDQTVIGPITRPDLAVLVVGCVLNTECENKIYHSTDQSLAGAMGR